ncbi:helix-turn-helix domain-containing protein [Actinomadura fulvescens]|uniref:PucR C-terminal helix-turn-helix domain-containing protein n=1 Tax=Actinomadura fulvescens TaxID=46160 RepID=A0ABN3Q968_9ACTN
MQPSDTVIERVGWPLFADAATVAALRACVPDVAAEITVRIRREIPGLGGAPQLASLVEDLVGHFVESTADPALPAEEVLERVRRAGAAEAIAGRGPEALHAAIRLGAGIAVARLADRGARAGTGSHAVGLIEAMFAYTGRIEEAVTRGHRGAISKEEQGRRALVDLLVRPDADELDIRELAAQVGWRPAGRVAVIALRPRGTEPARPMLPPGALLGLHRDPACVILPDPDGPGRRQGLEAGLGEWMAAIGPTVDLVDCERSLRWASRALDLMRRGRIPARRPAAAAEHLPLLMLDHDLELVDLVAADRLAPLDTVRPSLRHELAVTMLALMECHFRANVVAASLHVHPQTIRYRLRKLEDLFGEGLYDPRHQLELHLLLHARLKGRRRDVPQAS